MNTDSLSREAALERCREQIERHPSERVRFLGAEALGWLRELDAREAAYQESRAAYETTLKERLEAREIVAELARFLARYDDGARWLFGLIRGETADQVWTAGGRGERP